MLVTILPFFLAAHITVNDQYHRTEWAVYGPECTYDVLVNMSLANIFQENDTFCAMLATELKCRLKRSDILWCRFQNSRMKRSNGEEERCSNAKDFVPMRFPLGEEPFEIRFNSRGIENLVVYRTIPRWRLDMIKVIVSQLNIGFELRERRQRFTITENSMVSHCEVDVKFTRDGPESEEDGDSKEGEERFEIEFILPKAELAERIEIEKVRQPKKCSRRTIYFFGNHKDYSRGDGQLHVNMTTSVSHITISKDKFVSYTTSEGVMKTANESRIMQSRQNISLKLKRINLVPVSLPEIPNPASASLFTFSYLEAIPEEA